MGEGLDQDEGKVVIFNLWKSVKLDLEIYALFSVSMLYLNTRMFFENSLLWDMWGLSQLRIQLLVLAQIFISGS